MIDNIQILRGIAALAVVFSHVKFIGIGGFGVDIFFAISGFIMAYITKSGSTAFISKRVVRIVPLYWFMTIAICLVAIAAPSTLASTTLNMDFFLKSLFFIPFDKNGYIEPLLSVGWTLNYEVFFYVVFFFSMKINHEKRVLFSSVFLLAMPIIGAALDYESVLFDFYTSSILIEFIFGMLIYEVYRRNWSFKWGQGPLILIVVFSFFLMCMIDAKSFIEYRFFIWGLPSAIIVLLCVCGVNKIPFPVFLNFVGKISFSLYLSHLFVIIGFDRLIYSLDVFSIWNMFLVVMLVFVCLVVSAISWYFIERLAHNYLTNKYIVPRK